MDSSTYRSDLVSVICPARNSSAYLARAIRSVAAQTFQSWELLIVDDGSNDETERIARSFEARDSRILVRRHHLATGVHEARNTALNEARGRWVAFLDSDDEWLPEKLERSISFAVEHESPLTFTGFRPMDTSGLRIGRYFEVPHTVNLSQIRTLNVIVTSSALVDRSMTGPIRMKNVVASDFACWLEILHNHKLAYGLSEDLVRYRITPKSLSRNKLNVPRKIWRIYRDVENLGLVSSALNLLLYVVRSGLKYIRMIPARR